MSSPAVEKSYTVPDATEGFPDQPLRKEPLHAGGQKVTFRVARGNRGDTTTVLKDYITTITTGMAVLDAIHQIQAESAPDLACRWNCKAGKCGSCSAEVNGNPKLMCMTRLETIDVTKPVTIEPMRAFPAVKDLISDVSWNYEVKKRIKKF